MNGLLKLIGLGWFTEETRASLDAVNMPVADTNMYNQPGPLFSIVLNLIYIAIFLLPIVLIIAIIKKEKRRKNWQQHIYVHHVDESEDSEEASETLDFKNAYQRRWLFSNNEKVFYSKLKQFADENGLLLFAKVRLLDLIEPRQNQKYYKTYFYKIQAKHVDFVLCTPNLVAKYIIELDDASHEASDRKGRDSFVDTVLTSCGYKVLHTRAFDFASLNNLIQSDQ